MGKHTYHSASCLLHVYLKGITVGHAFPLPFLLTLPPCIFLLNLGLLPASRQLLAGELLSPGAVGEHLGLPEVLLDCWGRRTVCVGMLCRRWLDSFCPCCAPLPHLVHSALRLSAPCFSGATATSTSRDREVSA